MPTLADEIHEFETGVGASITNGTNFLLKEEAKRVSPTPLEMLRAICDEIFERWDKDQRSGKLLLALAGRLPKYRDDVDQVREALMKFEPSTVELIYVDHIEEKS